MWAFFVCARIYKENTIAVGAEHDRIKRNKRHKYQKNQYVQGYVPGEEIRDVQKVEGDIIISNPIVVEEVVRPRGINYIQRLVPLDTLADGDLASLNVLDKAPIPGTNLIIALNGRVVVPADGPGDVAVSAAWIESPTGIVRAHGAAQIGDLVKWNGSIAGVEVLSTDELILIYEVDPL